ncbi:serine hydrolase domain-containing protein [Neorhodopirellula pilleata]|uniref:D-alanyl-D-alanine carboxypeptidase n=1 Tax=Neorhodopirellula pilleata TaxID=2714738 RepID=A0A5C6AWE9_9BACT|nr:serine hydrolase domain-containing protein [Neorhodopirellula pilleata]TWU03396.1 D-alanyl-D-alanine carboxypeptidase precursor [Neorhodopirellula pilleata]
MSKLLILFASAAWLLFAAVTLALDGKPIEDPEAIEMDGIGDVVRRWIPTEAVGGVGVLVTQNGIVQHQQGYGFVKGRRVTSRTPLRLASITKQYAAMCAAMLIEEGRLDMDAKVSHYLPKLNLPVKGRELYVKDLMWHTSGLANFIEKKEQAAIAKFKQGRGLPHLTNETHAEWLETMDLRRAPGIEHEYTNSGYVLLTRIIEVIAGEPFHEFQQRRIFDVLELNDTTDSERFNGSGNMVTTLVDYAKWDKALWDRDPRLLSEDGYEMIFNQGKFDNGDPIEYGFGWQVRCKDDQLQIAEHGGGGSGTTAARNWIRRHFEDGTTVAFFAQEYPQLNTEARMKFSSELYEAVLKARSATE